MLATKVELQAQMEPDQGKEPQAELGNILESTKGKREDNKKKANGRRMKKEDNNKKMANMKATACISSTCRRR